jgi:hypothetical protein
MIPVNRGTSVTFLEVLRWILINLLQTINKLRLRIPLTTSEPPYPGGTLGNGGKDPRLEPFGYGILFFGPSMSLSAPSKKLSSIPCDGLLKSTLFLSSSSISGPRNYQHRKFKSTEAQK